MRLCLHEGNGMSSDVIGALKRTSKGQLTYDSKWRDEGRTEEIVNSVKQSVSSISLTPKSVLASLQAGQQSPISASINAYEVSRLNGTSKWNVTTHCWEPATLKPAVHNGTPFAPQCYPITVNNFCDASYDRDELERIKQYEHQRSDRVQKETEKYSQRIKEKNESLQETIEGEMRLIQKKFLLLNLQKQKQYEEEYEQLLKDVEQQQKSNETQQSSTVTKGASLKLKEIQEKEKLLMKQEEIKRLQQAEFKQALIKNKEFIDRIFQECEQCQLQQSALPPNVGDELNHYKTLLQGLLKDLDLLLLTSSEFTMANVQYGLSRQQRSIEIKQKFSDAIQQHIARTRPAVVTPATSSTVPTVNSVQQNEANNAPGALPITTSTTVTNLVNNSKLKPASVPASKSKDEFTLDAKSIYIQCQLDLVALEEKCKLFMDNKANGKLRIALQLSVRTPINQLCNQSLRELKAKTHKLLDLFNGRPGNHNVRCSPDNNSLYFVINDAAKLFLNVAYKQKNMALKLAPVILYLWAKVPLFGKTFLAQLFRNCPYALPYYPVRQANQSDMEYMVTCGYQLNSDGHITETDEIYQERMYALVQLYSAVIQCNLNQGHPRDLHYAWNWLARTLNDAPRPRITALMLDAFLSVSAHKLLRIYGRQFQKMIAYISNVYMQKIEAITERGERQTLMKFQSLLDDIKLKMSTSREGWRALAQTLDLVPDNYFS